MTPPQGAVPEARIEGLVGLSVGPSRWFAIDQARISAFGDLTEDFNPIHRDPAASPFGHTVSIGFLTLSLLSAMAEDGLPAIAGEAYKLNYGFDRVRFLAPVPSGRRVRGRGRISAVAAKGPGRHLLTLGMAIDIERAERPALIADWLVMVVTTTGATSEP